MNNWPSYLNLKTSGELQKRAQQAAAMLKQCTLCPHYCHINRIEGQSGLCRAGSGVRISGASPHYGEEDVLVGDYGSGTIFFTHCNLRCIFCQNYETSHQGHGRGISLETLAQLMLNLQGRGCANINFVSPTHYAAQIVQAVNIAAEQGLRLPLVYNSGGYDSLETLKLMDGIIDIYMPDLKFFNEDTAFELTGVPGYPEAARASLKEMHRQVGDLQVDEQGLARRGLIVRHLVMPGGLADTAEVVKFIAEEISPHTYMNIMGQYFPEFKAKGHSQIGRRVTRQEVTDARRFAKEAGLSRVVF